MKKIEGLENIEYEIFSNEREMIRYYKDLYQRFNKINSEEEKQKTISNIIDAILCKIEDNDRTYKKIKKNLFIFKSRKLKYAIEKNILFYQNPNEDQNKDMMAVFIKQLNFINEYNILLTLLGEKLYNYEEISFNDVRKLSALFSLIIMSYLNSALAFSSEVDEVINMYRGITYIDNSGINREDQVAFLKILFEQLNIKTNAILNKKKVF